MATVQEQRPAAGKHESFVEAQLERARRRIRLFDLGAAALVLVVGTLAFGLAMVLLDRSLQLSPLARQLAFGAWIVAAAAYAVRALAKPFRLPVNPYYAARQ